MTFFCEINKTGQEHTIINSCLLNMLSRLDKAKTLEVYVDPSHYDHFKDKPLNVNLNFKKVVSPEKSNKLRWILKLLSEMILITEIVIRSKRKAADLVFFSSLSPLGNWYLSFILPLINKKSKFLVVMHGELELAKSENWPKSIERLYAKLLRSCFNKPCKNRKFLILGKVVLDNILQYGLLRKEQVICIEHPYIFDDLPSTLNNSGPIVFGHLGVAKLAKNSNLFCTLAESMQKHVDNGEVRFEIIGQVFDEMKPYLNKYVSYKETTTFLSRAEYDQKSMALTYCLFFYDEQSYEFTSSGAVLDAITYEKPIIGFDIALFRNIFESGNGCEPGYLFQNFDEMKKGIEKLILEHQVQYQQKVACITSKKNLYSIDALLPSLEAQINRFKEELV